MAFEKSEKPWHTLHWPTTKDFCASTEVIPAQGRLCNQPIGHDHRKAL